MLARARVTFRGLVTFRARVGALAQRDAGPPGQRESARGGGLRGGAGCRGQRRVQVSAGLRDPPAQHPVPGQRVDHAQRAARRPAPERRVQGPAQIGAFLVEEIQPPPLLRAVQQPARAHGQFGVVGAVPLAHGVELARLPELFGAVLPYGLQDAVPRPVRPVRGHHQGAVHQAGEEVEHIGPAHGAARADGPRGVERAAVVHGQAPQNRALRRCEQRPAPVDDRAEGALPRRGAAEAAGEQGEPVVDAGQQPVHPHRAYARRRQLQRQREPVQADAQFGDRLRVVRAEPRPGAVLKPGPPPEQFHGARQVERRHRPHPLAAHVERLLAGREDAEPRYVTQQYVRQLGDRVHEMLAVVEYDEQPPPAQRPRQPPGRGHRGTRLLMQPEHPGHRLGHGVRAAPGRAVEARELDQPHPVGKPVREPLRRRDGEPRLAHPAGPGEGHKAGHVEELTYSRHVVVPPDEAGDGGGKVGAGRCPGPGVRFTAVRRRPEGTRGSDVCGSAAWARPATTRPRRINGPSRPRGGAAGGHSQRSVQRRILAQDRPVQRREFRPRREAEVVREAAAQILVRVEGLRLAARAVQRAKLRGPQPLPQRMAPDQVGEVRGERPVLAQLQARLGLFLPRGEPVLLQAADRAARERGVGEARERLAAPQPQRLLQEPRLRAGPVRGRPRPLQQEREPARVDRVRRDAQRVTGGPRRDQGPAARLGPLQRPAELGHLALERVRRMVGQLLAPQPVDQPVRRHRVAGVHQQMGQERADLGTGDGRLRAVRRPHGRRTEHPESHADDDNPPGERPAAGSDDAPPT
ncbi:putative Regulator protein [Streptomyces aurantiacus JA 4570]|uniref:Putative Regulator protein n=1 Tax=Streptomyces aurantiacus JA 4570 TaxID=1286094 RepID=S3ZD70_9ACTN|nr:putative Regulator protein [Streptomyces aurantiacus JA 4570]